MNGYFEPNFKNEKKEFHCLELKDCDFVTDDNDVEIHHIKRHKHNCPRCKSIIQTSDKDAYCSECNWDSLTDFAYENEECTA